MLYYNRYLYYIYMDLEMFTMLNHAEIVQRIEDFRLKEELSAAAFAQKIGVPRSSLSHLISGRNNPSLDLLVKITTIFPQLSLDELVFGKPTTTLSLEKSIEVPEAVTDSSPVKTSVSENTKNPESEIVTSQLDSIANLEQVILLYKDGSFKNYSTKS